MGKNFYTKEDKLNRGVEYFNEIGITDNASLEMIINIDHNGVGYDEDLDESVERASMVDIAHKLNFPMTETVALGLENRLRIGGRDDAGFQQYELRGEFRHEKSAGLYKRFRFETAYRKTLASGGIDQFRIDTRVNLRLAETIGFMVRGKFDMKFASKGKIDLMLASQDGQTIVQGRNLNATSFGSGSPKFSNVELSFGPDMEIGKNGGIYLVAFIDVSGRESSKNRGILFGYEHSFKL
jgi:hypothetical protein